jgi:hypothetical protein
VAPSMELEMRLEPRTRLLVWPILAGLIWLALARLGARFLGTF